MIRLSLTFLKIFLRNLRAILMTVLLPGLIFVGMAFLESSAIIEFDSSISYRDFLLAGIIAYALLQTGIYMTAYTLLDYRRTGILKRFAATPLPAGKFLAAQIFSRFIIGALQALVLLLIAVLFFDVNVRMTILFLPFIIFVGIAVFITFGFLIAGIARDYEEAAPYTTIVTIVLAFVGDVFFSVQNFPDFLQTLSRILPLAPLSRLVRYALFGVGEAMLAESAIVLMIWFVIMFSVSRFVFQRHAYK
jgi:ABC-2 type transport system permease protein